MSFHWEEPPPPSAQQLGAEAADLIVRLLWRLHGEKRRQPTLVECARIVTKYQPADEEARDVMVAMLAARAASAERLLSPTEVMHRLGWVLHEMRSALAAYGERVAEAAAVAGVEVDELTGAIIAGQRSGRR